MKRAIPGYELFNRDTRERWRIIGATQADEVHTGNVTGHINVSAMWRDIEANRALCQLMSVWIDAGSRRMLENQDIDEVRLAQITPERAEKSGIAIHPLKDGTTALVDGTHRFKWRDDHGYRNFWLYAFTPEAAELYRVRFKYRPRGGLWRELDADEMLRKLQGMYTVLGPDGRLAGIRKASTERIAELQARHDRIAEKSKTGF